ncbi:MAG TPA: HAD-IIIA family hydrolase [Gemmatimonadales bacterium]|nr:HAD-IIIA family hydrolase [Gemmatimonadales bacterium]
MIVYRTDRRTAAPRPLLGELRRSLAGAAGAGGTALHDRVVSLLVDCGSVEAAVADALCPEHDRETPAGGALGAATHALARAAWHAWHAREEAARAWLRRAGVALDAALAHPLPDPVELGVPEGFAYYGLTPEQYFEAAARFAGGRRGAAVCLGLRSIGATLAACVAAALAELHWEVESYTLRPRGHPFDRRLALSPELSARLGSRLGRWFLVVDEGPGLSGSSFAAALDALAALGVPDERIAIFPSWRTDGSSLRSARARAWWPRVRHELTDFDEAWIAPGRLSRAFDASLLADLSAGRWRERWMPPGSPWPAVQPQHERRKYLAAGPQRMVLRFAGLGRYGESVLRRAHALAEAGLGPAPHRLAHGFLALPWVPGTPLARGDADAGLVECIARHAATRREAVRCEPGAAPSELEEMAGFNVASRMGEAWGDAARRLLAGAAWGDRAAAVDGHMLPHEWIRTRTGYEKADALEHGDDHFLPGPQDVAWDLAGAAVELALDRAAERALVERYAALAGDPDVARRLPAYRLAYLALRLGYASLAADSLGDSDDGARFRAAVRRHQAQLRRLLAPVRAARGARVAAPGYDLVIFDADGTLRRTTVPGRPCPYGPGEWELRPGARSVLRRLLRGPSAPRVGLASNQDRVGYGELRLEDARALLHDLARAALDRGLPDEAVQLCPHTAEAGCRCRKPEPQMLERIMRFYGVAPERTLFVGDAASDREAARRAGVAFRWAAEFFPDPAGAGQQT